MSAPHEFLAAGAATRAPGSARNGLRPPLRCGLRGGRRMDGVTPALNADSNPSIRGTLSVGQRRPSGGCALARRPTLPDRQRSIFPLCLPALRRGSQASAPKLPRPVVLGRTGVRALGCPSSASLECRPFECLEKSPTFAILFHFIGVSSVQFRCASGVQKNAIWQGLTMAA